LRRIGPHRTLAVVIGAPRRAALAAVLVGVTLLPRSAAAQEEEARLHFRAGVNLLQDPENPRFEEAYVEFKRAYELARSPSILGNIGLCAMKLERDAEALDAYTRYLAEAPGLDAAEREQTERDIVTLRAGLARVSVESRPDGAVIHDTRVTGHGPSMTNRYGPIMGKTELGIRRGHHVFHARFPDGGEVSWEADVNGGESHVFDLPPKAATQTPPAADRTLVATRPVPPSVYIGAVATGAFAVGAVVTGLLALDASSRFDDANDGSQQGRAEDLRSSAGTLNVTTDILIGAAVVGGLVTTTLFLLRPTVSSRTASSVLRF
jgi:hypothetical protein